LRGTYDFYDAGGQCVGSVIYDNEMTFSVVSEDFGKQADKEEGQ
jgi:hypothetical protein